MTARHYCPNPDHCTGKPHRPCPCGAKYSDKPRVRPSRSEARKAMWADPAYRTRMLAHLAVARAKKLERLGAIPVPAHLKGYAATIRNAGISGRAFYAAIKAEIARHQADSSPALPHPESREV